MRESVPASITAPAPQSTASRRQPELDALRGLLLVWMTIIHLPTHWSFYSNQPFGFVSAAEGFIFLSALLCGRVFGRKLETEGFRSVARRIGSRAARLYGYHLLLLVIAFTAVAHWAIRTQNPSLQGLVDFYLAHPTRGIIASVLLIYRPPLLDILPMYILFLLATPFALWVGKRRGWKVIIVPSLLLWAAAQFGLRAAVYEWTTHLTHVDIPMSALGAFDLYAWQILWAFGLWIGSGRPRIVPLEVTPRTAIVCASMLAALFFTVRHTALWDKANTDPWLPLTDKWHLGPVRLLNFAALATLFSSIQDKAAHWLAIRPLMLLGQASLEVFCAHLLICFAALAVVGDGTNLNSAVQALLVTCSLAALLGVGWLFAKQRAPGIRPRRED